MTTVSEIKQKAERKYANFLTYKINCFLDRKADESFFPLHIKTDKGKANEHLQKYGQEIALLLEKSKNKTGSGYTLAFEEISTRNYGRQQKLKDILFESEEDYLSFIKKKHETKNLVNALDILKTTIFLSGAELNEWALAHAKDLTADYSEETNFWQNICLCVNWLYENPKSGLYIREIPLSVHTKFIETYTSLIHSFFAKDGASDFEAEHGLKQKPYLVRFRSLDEMPLIFANLSVSELSLSLHDFIRLDKSDCLSHIQTILLVENEMVYLTFPKMQNALCVWGHGFSVTMLQQCDWLRNYKLLYFGDLDEHGFQILSDFRKYFPQTESFCMDLRTLQNFSDFRCKGKTLSGNVIPANLTHEEKEAFEALRKNDEKNRLEQERISVEYIQKNL